MDKIHVRLSVSQPCLTDAVIVILNGLLSCEHPSIPAGSFFHVSKEIFLFGEFGRTLCSNLVHCAKLTVSGTTEATAGYFFL